MNGLALYEEEEGEEFYESLDRILSSSCSSTSASDDDADYHRRRLPRFPPDSAASLDVWLSGPASVEERRRRFLHQLGLAENPALSRRRTAAAPDDSSAARRPFDPEIGRSASCDGLLPGPKHHYSAAAAAVPRSRSEGSADQPAALGSRNPRKPPLFQSSRPPSAQNLEVSYREVTEGDKDDRRCTIRNLDNGKEFVVREFREDGMWNKLREVGTGRQLTVEEFETSVVGQSPIVQELMRRESVDGDGPTAGRPKSGLNGGPQSKRRGGSWLRNIKTVAGAVVGGGGQHRDIRSSDERDTSSEKGGRRSSSATDDSQDGPPAIHEGPQRVKVRHYGKSHKDLACLYMSQEVQAHNGSIWSIKFSLDGRYLASAGEDCVIHVWRVSEENGNRNPFVCAVANGSPEPAMPLACFEVNHLEKKRRAKVSGGRKSVSSDILMVPDILFALSDKPVCTFRGHLEDVLDLSWSKSQYLLSSSMDKTVRLWHMSSSSCLRTFSHSDYVTCIQFNPVDDRYFISGSLDEKVRIWSIPDRQVVDWNDLHEMVTAACYTPDGQGALVGSHKGSCHLYNTSDNKLFQKSQIDLQNKKKKSSCKKITGFQFAPGSSSEVLITSADSRIRVINGVELVHKFKGFRNTSSQISASLTPNGKYVTCASEDSHVYVWRYDADSRPGKSKGSTVPITQSYEHFHCRNVTVAIPWPGNTKLDHEPLVSPRDHGQYNDRVSATWPEENLFLTADQHGSQSNDEQAQSRSACGVVIVIAGRGGEIKAFQNFGIPVRI